MHADMHDPRFNLRELVKELLLLEDHLSCTEKQCAECIIKHALKAEAWVDEALTLGPNDTLRTLLIQLRTTTRQITAWVSTRNYYQAQPAIRRLRRDLQRRM